MRVLEGLEGIKAVEMDLVRDAFTVSYLPSRVERMEILARIRRLGFRPEPVDGLPPARSIPNGSGGTVPRPVREALDRARKEDRLLLIHFFADWCPSCVTLEREVLVEVRAAGVLRSFRVLKIDADREPETVPKFRILALPTLLVLDGEGNEIYRHEGAIGPAELAEDLLRLEDEKK